VLLTVWSELHSRCWELADGGLDIEMGTDEAGCRSMSRGNGYS
jgi:hypothetical protein